MPILGLQSSSQNISSYGKITYVQTITINVDYSSQIGTNNLELGSQVHYWMELWDNPTLQDQARAAKMKLIRYFVFWEDHNPCTSWDETTHKGTWDWTELDKNVDAILALGAEPLLCLNPEDQRRGACSLPPGMQVNPITQTPYAESFAAYAKAVAQHFKDRGITIKHWEVFNEPASIWTYYPDPYIQENKPIWAEFVNIFNVVTSDIHGVFTNALVGTSTGCARGWSEYLAEHGVGVDWIGTHKYDSGWGNEYADDEELFRRAVHGLGYEENEPRVHDFLFTPDEALDKWEQIRGLRPPFYLTETNLNYEWNPFDHRAHQVIGAAWFAEQTRDLVMRGVRYSLWYELAGPTTSGFGMVELWGSHDEGYPYYVNSLISQNLEYGNPLFEANSSDPELVSVLAWRNANRICVMLIMKQDAMISVNVNQLTSGGFTLYRIDGSKVEIHEEVYGSNPRILTLQSYTVALLTFPADGS
jgi:hypothetical protein